MIGFGSGVTPANLNQIAQAGGTHNYSDNTKSYYLADNADQLVDAIEDIVGCHPYSSNQRSSCSYDCQTYGRYCGDGNRDNLDGEQCDDGNTDNTDSCRNNCTTQVAMVPAEVLTGQCGDGVKQDGTVEECDFGVANGVKCTPGYNQSCTYCSSGTREAGGCRTLTVDAVAYCGNSKRDFVDTNNDGSRGPYTVNGSQVYDSWAEACDNVGGSVTRVENGTALSCPDKGGYTCTNNCQTFTDACVTCAPTSTASAGAIPRIAILNPMFNKLGAGDWDDVTVSSLSRGPSVWQISIPPGQNYSWLEDPTRDFYVYNNISIGTYHYNFQNVFGNYTLPRLPADAVCNGLYKLSFNDHGTADNSLGITNMSSQGLLPTGEVDNFVATTSRDFFDYQVNGETGLINNEFIISGYLYLSVS